MKCDCPLWTKNEPKINGPIVLASIRAGYDIYDGDLFRFCPWCGKALVEDATPTTEVAACETGGDR